MRKAQMEIFGLVFIVIIILVGFLIFLTIQPSPGVSRGLKSEYERTQMATNFIDSVLQVSTGCGSQALGAVLSTCETAGSAGSAGFNCESGRAPCDEAKYILELALNNSLEVMQYDYQLNFSIVNTGEVRFSIPDTPLTCINRVKAGVFPFQSLITGRMLQLRLDVCE
jgi:hypothetical protein